MLTDILLALIVLLLWKMWRSLASGPRLALPGGGFISLSSVFPSSELSAQLPPYLAQQLMRLITEFHNFIAQLSRAQGVRHG